MGESVMSKHTPGPWFATRNSAYWEVLPNNPGMGVPWTVADICPSDPGNPDGGLQEANARLIAAAPELLEAVERLLIGAAACAIPHPKEREVLQMAVDFAIQAKRKAKGEVNS